MRQATSSEAHVLGTSAQSLLRGPPCPVRRRRAAAAWGRKVAGGSMAAFGRRDLEVLT